MEEKTQNSGRGCDMAILESDFAECPPPMAILESDIDVLTQIFDHLDAFSATRMAAVCTTWRAAASQDHLWSGWARQRWNLPEKRGRYKFGERSWREVYRVFHRRLRMPLTIGVSEREVVYSAGKHGSIYAWLLVNHKPACELAERWGRGEEAAGVPRSRVFSCRILLQNLSERPIRLDVRGGLCIAMRDGSVSKPLATPEGAGEGEKVAGEQDAADHAGIVRLYPMCVGLISDVAFRMPAHMRFEPDVLEAAETLIVRAASANGSSIERIEIACPFADEATIWEHYEEINRGFFVHVESDK